MSESTCLMPLIPRAPLLDSLKKADVGVVRGLLQAKCRLYRRKATGWDQLVHVFSGDPDAGDEEITLADLGEDERFNRLLASEDVQ